MRIFYVTNSRIPTERAHGFQIMKTCEALEKLGHTVELVIPKTFNHIKIDPFDYYSVDKNFSISYIPSFDWRTFGHLGYILHTIYFTITAILYSFFVKKDVVFSRDITISFLLSFFYSNTVFEDHEPPTSKRGMYAFFLRKIPKKIIVPNALAELYDTLGIEKESFTVIPNGVDIEEFDSIGKDKNIWEKHGISADIPIVLYVGYFHAWKGVYTLLKSAQYLENAQIVLIGATDETEGEIESYIQKKGIKRAYILPFMPHKEAIVYEKSADVVVLPNTAKEERSRNYTTPIKLFEYMASGVPIVASKIPSFSAFIKDGENAIICEPDNAKDLAEKIRWVIENPDKSKTLSEHAFRDVQEYSWDKRAKKIIEFVYPVK